ncbi:MAG: polysaccharide biosynthesis protein [Propionibacteriaceae bacterium]|jgi:dTDP-glucose 4,6-dehydratase|nr:polysaccharide biosynthesis protein [Propionibacteriaceae bacterium]
MSNERPTQPHASTSPKRTLAIRSVRQYVLDSVCLALAVVVSGVLRYEFDMTKLRWEAIGMMIACVVAVQLLVSLPLRLYRHRYFYGSFEEVTAVVVSVAANALINEVIVLALWYPNPWLRVPRSLMVIVFPISVVLMLGVRYVTRLVLEARARSKAESAPAIVYGAGYVGSEIVRQLTTDAKSPYHPVALLDDDPAKRRTRIRNVDVAGTFEDLAEVADKTRAEVLIVAIAAADSKLLRRVSDAARPLGLEVKVVPTIEKMLGGPARVAVNLRALSIDDLIGRQPVDTNLAEVGGYLTGKRVLITGAGGSIGVELCRQVHRFGPKELIMLDRDETGLQNAEVAVSGHGLLNDKEVVLADIRDAARLREIFVERAPEVVFHAAALKHLPMLQQYPTEGWKTNVIGSLNVLEAAAAAGVTTFVNISTDKAADPTSVLGYSKLMAEKLTAFMARKTGAHYISVRFGNVLGSRGSMLPLFVGQIEKGGPVTVTHPEVTRYFMTIPEACQLVLQAGAIGQPGEALILDMGEPVSILEIAKRMIDMSGKAIDIEFVGLRPGEKLHEALVSHTEEAQPTEHKKISRAPVEVFDPADLDMEAWLATLSTGE